MTVDPSMTIRQTIRKEMVDLDEEELFEIRMDDRLVNMDHTFEEEEIWDAANLTLQIITYDTITPEFLFTSIMEYNPQCDAERVYTQVHKNRDHRYQGGLDLSNCGLKNLPESFGLLTHTDLNLSHNELEALPESFGSISVTRKTRSIDLSYNRLRALPKNFGGWRVKVYSDGGRGPHPPEWWRPEFQGDLSLHDNELETLPESFGDLQIRGRLNLANNNLTSLPDSFENMKVRETLNINNNPLSEPSIYHLLRFAKNNDE